MPYGVRVKMIGSGPGAPLGTKIVVCSFTPSRAGIITSVRSKPGAESGSCAESDRGKRKRTTVSSTQIAFAYAGDIWVVSRDGGDAKRLTSFPGTESDPHFSPDGKQIAFSMQYGGNTDVYVIDAAGGEARRLTRHPAPDIARGWAPDARRVLFSSVPVGAPSVGVQQVCAVAAAGGRPARLPIPDGLRGSFSPDGQRVAYEKVSRWDVEWRNYRGG